MRPGEGYKARGRGIEARIKIAYTISKNYGNAQRTALSCHLCEEKKYIPGHHTPAMPGCGVLLLLLLFFVSFICMGS
jgi:hypothetical protein